MSIYNYTTLDISLHDPLAPRPTGTLALGINDSGQIVGQYNDLNGHTYGFLYSGGTYNALNAPSASFTSASAINGSGLIVGYYASSTVAQTVHGFLYNPNGNSYTAVDDPFVTNGGGTFGYGINASQIGGSYINGSGTHGF